MTRATPDLLLERYRLNELPDAARAAIEREAAGDPVLQARLEALDRSDAEVLERYAPHTLIGRRSTRRRGARGLVLTGAFAAILLAVLVMMPRRPVAMDNETRIKGGVAGRPGLVVYRRTPAGSERLADGDVAHPGDLLRIGYNSAGRTYGVILSIDGTGAVTTHLPPAGDFSASLAAGDVHLLDSSYELDAAPRIERFYLVTGTHPFKVAPVLAAARRAGGAPDTLPLPAGLEQVTFAVHKEVSK